MSPSSSSAADIAAIAANELTTADFKQHFGTSGHSIKLCYYTNYHAVGGKAEGEGKPILLLLHGYPESYVMSIL